jgi:UPF0755 protein
MFPLTRRQWGVRIVALGVVLFVLYKAFFAPPIDFPVNKLIHIPKGSSVSAIADKLVEQNIIHDAFLFKALVFLNGGSSSIKAGTYVFSGRKNAFSLIITMREGNFGKGEIWITIPEGYSNTEIAKRLASLLPNINEVLFIEKAVAYEGELFPDTYFFSKYMTEGEIIEAMHLNFLNRTSSLFEKAGIFGKAKEEVIIMASILEKEASRIEDQKMIAGILWKRLKSNMLLQVDATVSHVVPRNTFNLTNTDLATSSPYNTYKYKGLPPGPIGNPGFSALEAALEYTDNPYWFYLADYSGTTHYSETYEEHSRKKAIYLN